MRWNYLGWVSPRECISFQGWLDWYCRDSHGQFRRIFGFEFHNTLTKDEYFKGNRPLSRPEG